MANSRCWLRALRELKKEEMKSFEGDSYIPQEILKLKERFGINTVLETGSQYGFTLKWLKENFEQVFGCEINTDFYNYCMEQGLPVTNTESVKAIDFISTHYTVGLYYLDAHGFGMPCPLKKELEAIAEKGHQPVIVIHDFKVPGKDFGFDAYEYELCYEEIEPYLKQIYPAGFDYHYNTEANGAKRGVIYCYPKV